MISAAEEFRCRVPSRGVLIRLSILFLAACGASTQSPAPRAPDYIVNSIGSVYTPSARFRAYVTIESDELRIVVDTAEIVARGTLDGTSPPVVHNLTIRALIAMQGAGESRWRAVATSEPIAFTEPLHLGEHRIETDLRFRVPIPAGLDAERAWLVFALEGDVFGRITGTNRAQTFVCAERNLAGSRAEAAARAELMRTDYLAAC